MIDAILWALLALLVAGIALLSWLTDGFDHEWDEL